MSPIKKEKRHLYPENWDQISSQFLTEYDQRCELCGVCNHSTGYRSADGSFRALSRADQPIALQTLKDCLSQNAKLFKIVLTVHHLDSDPTNNSRENLIALCQKCRTQELANHE